MEHARVAPPAYLRVASEIRAGIDSGRLKPGDRLGTDEDLEEMGVGRGTFREAVRLLEAERLVAVFRGVRGGTFVAAPSVAGTRESLTLTLEKLLRAKDSEFDDLLALRTLLEVFAARLAATHRTASELKQLDRSVGSVDRAPQNVFACSWRFHSTILEAAHNPFLKAVAEPISAAIRMRSGTDSLTLPFIEDDHSRLLRCIQHRDVEGAGDEMRQHLLRVEGAWQEFDHSTAKRDRPSGARRAVGD